ncbi:SpoIIIAH-like family protein [Alicyclobacillus cycloheptanicus]|uniref:Stage III sporulation protein AH n=1 Tax=Alicyclobacillus cycloheptanicus TaxID=1457 RepID=A0ABT9XF29_9BACL|nr:stage III sporulation protein AH [Alicyclobacillus cycloheptanicus]WDM01064.1 SpoIIIAH-like family protein [Alicyclobacillus cycloheptanicus]
MVKRQTVWLSTMMVLSLMLIGYYTMNGGQTTTTSSTDTSPSISTTTTQENGSSSQGSQNAGGTTATGSTSASTGKSASQSTSKSSSSVNAATGPSSGADWFTNYQTQVEQQISQKEAAATQIIANSNASTQQLAQAQQELRQYMNLDGAISDARQQILGEGFKNCVIAPNATGQGAQVYVQTNKLSAEDAVKVMNIVSQQLNIPINSVIVHQHA